MNSWWRFHFFVMTLSMMNLIRSLFTSPTFLHAFKLKLTFLSSDPLGKTMLLNDISSLAVAAEVTEFLRLCMRPVPHSRLPFFVIFRCAAKEKRITRRGVTLGASGKTPTVTHPVLHRGGGRGGVPAIVPNPPPPSPPPPPALFFLVRHSGRHNLTSETRQDKNQLEDSENLTKVT